MRCKLCMSLLANLIKWFDLLITDICSFNSNFRKNGTVSIISSLVGVAEWCLTYFTANDSLELPSLSVHSMQTLLILHLRCRCWCKLFDVNVKIRLAQHIEICLLGFHKGAMMLCRRCPFVFASSISSCIKRVSLTYQVLAQTLLYVSSSQ